MSDYDDYLKDQDRFFAALDDLAMAGSEAEWKRRLRSIATRLNKPEDELLRVRRRLIRQAMKLRPDFTEAQAAAWVDTVVGLDPAN